MKMFLYFSNYLISRLTREKMHSTKLWFDDDKSARVVGHLTSINQSIPKIKYMIKSMQFFIEFGVDYDPKLIE